MALRHLTPADYQTMPWRNGRGITTELAREDVSGNMLWRVSQADVVEPGPFSRFPGIDRILMLVEGDGFELDFGPHGGVVPLEPLVPVRFCGDWDTQARNVRGTSRDLNVMVDRRLATANVEVHQRRFARTMTSRSMFLALHGQCGLAIGGTLHTLAPGELLIADLAGEPAQGDGSGTLISIDISILPWSIVRSG